MYQDSSNFIYTGANHQDSSNLLAELKLNPGISTKQATAQNRTL